MTWTFGHSYDYLLAGVLIGIFVSVWAVGVGLLWAKTFCKPARNKKHT